MVLLRPGEVTFVFIGIWVKATERKDRKRGSKEKGANEVMKIMKIEVSE